jgi:hypothetical protein
MQLSDSRTDSMLAHAVRKEYVRRTFDSIEQRGSPVSADRALGLIRAIYNWAIYEGYVKTKPTIGLKKLNASKGRPVCSRSSNWRRYNRWGSDGAKIIGEHPSNCSPGPARHSWKPLMLSMMSSLKNARSCWVRWRKAAILPNWSV